MGSYCLYSQAHEDDCQSLIDLRLKNAIGGYTDVITEVKPSLTIVTDEFEGAFGD